MALDETEKEAIREWIDNAILSSDYCRWRNKLGESQPFPVTGTDILFDDGIQVLKYAVTSDYAPDTMGRDIRSLRNGKPATSSEYASWQKREKPGYAQKPVIYLYAAIIEAESGFYGLTEHEFNALKTLSLRGSYTGVQRAQEIAKGRPQALAKMEYKEFLELVNDVLRDRNLPEIDITAKLVLSAQGAVSTIPQTTVAQGGSLTPSANAAPVVDLAALRQELLMAQRKAAVLRDEATKAREALKLLDEQVAAADAHTHKLSTQLRQATTPKGARAPGS